MTTSWDCFDTLVTRRHYDPLSVLHIMGEAQGLDNFMPRRKAAESRAPWTLQTIYDELAKDYQWTEEQKAHYMQLEIEEELRQCCPIVENINRVQDGDLIVSDMYLPQAVIEAILRKNGLTKDVKVHVTTGGKSSGTIWGSLPPIELHVGDNHHSDVVSPQSAGIKGEFYANVHPMQYEQQFKGDLQHLMRVVRLACPYEHGSKLHAMWIDQAWLNIPALILASLELPADNLAFVMRDCLHLQRIHEAIHGKKNVSFHCSRIALKEGGTQWREYVESVAKGKTIVDLQGTGCSVVNYWMQTFGEKPAMIYLTGTMRFGTLLAPCYHDAIERFNSSALGTLVKFPNRKQCEFELDVLECQRLAIDCAISHIPYFSLEPDIELFRNIVNEMPNAFTVKKNKHIDNHESDEDQNGNNCTSLMKAKQKKAKVAKVMREFKAGTLKSSSGEPVKSRKQAIAIAMAEAGMSMKGKSDAYIDAYIDAMICIETEEEEEGGMEEESDSSCGKKR